MNVICKFSDVSTHMNLRLNVVVLILVEYQFLQKNNALKHCETTHLHQVTRHHIDLCSQRSKQAW